MGGEKFMKKIILIALVSCLTGCTATKEDSPKISSKSQDKEVKVEEVIAKGYREGDNVEVIQNSADLWINIQDPKVMWDNSDAIALATIDTIDGGDNTTDTGYCLPYTYGKMTIHEVYKGDIQIAKGVIYSRLGGTIPYEKYYNALPESQKQRIEMLKEKGEYEQPPEYIKEIFEDDIDIEVGKTYVVYLNHSNLVSRFDGGYVIEGFQAGLREISGNYKTKAGLKVYNNFTKTWDELQTLIIE